MKKRKSTLISASILTCLILLGYQVKAQTTGQKIGTNPTIKEASAVLELEATNKGILVTRVALTSTALAAPVSSPAAALTVFNTATTTTGTNDVTPGYYYWDGAKWVRMSILADEPWYNQATNTSANLNTQNIYQMGTVAIAKNAVLAGAILDVAGAIRGGTGHTGDVGANSAVFGSSNTIPAANAGAFGYKNYSDTNFENGLVFGSGNAAEDGGANSLLFGSGNELDAGSNNAIWGDGNEITDGSGTPNNSTVFGTNNTLATGNSLVFGDGNSTEAKAENSLAFGKRNTAKATNTLVTGENNIAASYNEVVIGQKNAIQTGTADSWVLTDPLLQVGNGTTTNTNALTILKNGNTGIGATAPNSTLQVAGSVATAVRSFTTSTSVTSTDYFLIFKGTTAETLTFPASEEVIGRTYVIKNLGSIDTTLSFPSATVRIHSNVAGGYAGTISHILRVITSANPGVSSTPNNSIKLIFDGDNWVQFL